MIYSILSRHFDAFAPAYAYNISFEVCRVILYVYCSLSIIVVFKSRNFGCITEGNRGKHTGYRKRSLEEYSSEHRGLNGKKILKWFVEMDWIGGMDGSD